ncbi:hypothetical protein WMF26_13095 [Sorangium sp. So ce185]|uniref:hypothetical protein n=1 Tax=Sorangium sp. So ce185 TaxID=3133287 RepID=UPI003F61AE78
MTPERIRSNFNALLDEGEAVLRTKKTGDYYIEVDVQASRKWVTSVTALIRSVFGENGSHYKTAINLQEKIAVWKHQLAQEMFGVLKSAAEAWDRGYVFEIKELAEAEVEASLMDQAEELLSKGYHQPAAVLAGSVLEQHLRSMCARHGVATHNENGNPLTLQPLNAALYKADAYDGNTQKHILALGAIRNSAAHEANATPEEAKRIVSEVPGLCGRLR